MNSVDSAAIRAKIDAWAASTAGQSKMRATVKKYIREDKRLTDAYSEVLTKGLFYEIAQEFVFMIKDCAASCGMPQSVMDNVNSLVCEPVKMFPDGSMSCELSFTANLFRPSLQPEKYGGINNIIALFNGGYSGASIHVWGWWHGELWRARPEREGLHFIDEAIRSFEGTYGAKYGISVGVIGPY